MQPTPPPHPYASTALPTGTQYEISSGTLRAVVTEVGAGLRSLTVDGTELLDTYAADEMPHGGRGQVLIPWPGRIANGEYTFEGTHTQAPINEPPTNSAIHGLVRWLNWRVASQEVDRITLELTLHPQPGYPFTLHVQETYALEMDRLAVTTTARNIGSAPLPYGVGHHPYFTVGTDLVDSDTLTVPANAYLRTNENSIPVPPPVSVQGSEYDFRQGHAIGQTKLDTGYTDLAFADGWGRVTFAAPSGGRRVVLAFDASHQFVQIFTGDHLKEAERRRRGLAIEPYTCAPNAFNNGLGLRVIQPGESFASTFTIGGH